jgi:hypothetical protein
MSGSSLLLVEYCMLRFVRQQGPLNDAVKARELLLTDMNSDNSRTSCQTVCFLSLSNTKESVAIL